jgi:curli biogenesis system outer membrane secretion channel CsgG
MPRSSRAVAAIVALSLILVALHPCAAYADITTEKWAKPWVLTQISVSSFFSPDIKRVAVMPFTVERNDRVQSESLMNQMSAAISQEGFLEVISRAEMEGVLGEQRFQQSGFADPGTVRDVGRLLGVDAIIVGSAPSITSETERHQEDVVDYYKEVQKEKKVWNKEKKQYETKYYTEREPVYKKVWVVEQWSHASLEAKLIEIETGSVLHAATTSGDYHNVNFDNEGTTYLEDTLKSWSVHDAIGVLKKHFTPYADSWQSYIVCYAADFINVDYQIGWEAALRGDFESALNSFRIAYRPDQIKGTREQVVVWDEIVVLAKLGRFDEMDERIDFFLKVYASEIEPSQKMHAEKLREFCALNLDRKLGTLAPAQTLQIVAIDEDDYYLTASGNAAIKPGTILVVVETKAILNELTGDVISTKETVVARLEVVEVTDSFIRCRLVEGSAKVGDRAKVE